MVERGGLENRCTPRGYRGFESLPLRNRLLIGLFCLFGLSSSLLGQPFYEATYRPGASYQLLRSPHFDVIFQRGLEAQAREATAILESNLDTTLALLGRERPIRMPVVLNRFNDAANGFVTPLMFRQEIEGVAVRGKILEPGFSSWMEQVLPHELTHAIHAEMRPRFGIGGFMALLWPDVSRLVNFTVPSGISEGIAVYRESELYPGSGRLNYSFFSMPIRAALASKRDWSLAEMLSPPSYTYPFDRFYIGGAYLVEYLAETRGPGVVGRSIRSYSRWPLFGYGFSLWVAAKQRPGLINRRFRRQARQQVLEEIDQLGSLTEPNLVAGRRGVQHRRPRWLDAQTLVAYAEGYDVRPGFYRFDGATGRRETVGHHGILPDRYYSIGPDGLYFARFEVGRTTPGRALSDLYVLDPEARRVRPLTHRKRVFAPVVAPNGELWALQNQDQFTRWVRVEADGNLTPLTTFPRSDFKELAPAPDGSVVVVLASVRGRQGLFTLDLDSNGDVAFEPLLVAERGDLYDPAWSADSRYLLFTADPDGIANVYALDRTTDTVYRLTNVAFGAFEPTLSPDGQTLAFIRYQLERRDLVTLLFDPATAERVSRSEFAYQQDAPWKDWLVESPFEPYSGEIKRYRTGPHLMRPRYLLPFVELETPTDDEQDVELGTALGLRFGGTDPLEQWAYEIQGFYRAERIWGEVQMQTAVTALRPELRVYAEPSTQIVRRVDQAGRPVDTVRVGREERAVSLSGSLPLIFSTDVYTTSAIMALRGRVRQVRFFDQSNDPLNEFSTRFTLSPRFAFGYRLQQNLRDLMPNTGLRFQADAELDAWTRDASPSRALITSLDVYVPVATRLNHGLRLRLQALTQNRGSIYDLDSFVPRGYRDELGLGSGTFAKFGVEYALPIWYIDNGFILLPIFFHGLSLYGFAETLAPVDQLDRQFSSIGGGVTLTGLLWNQFGITFRVGAAWRIQDREWEVIYR